MQPQLHRPGILSLLICLLYMAASTNAQQEETLYGKGSIKTTGPYSDLNDYKGTKTMVSDARGTVREEKIEATKTTDNVFGGTDTYKMESFTKYDCNGNPIYSRGVITKNGQEIRYEDAVYEPPKNKDGMSRQVSGFLRETNPDGTVTKKKFDPETGRMVEVANVAGMTENYASIEPAADICPAGRQHGIFIGPSFHREGYDGDGSGLIGVAAGYQLELTDNLEAVGHVSTHFKKDDYIKTQKTFIYAGINFFPFDGASPDDKVSAYAYGRAGMAFYSDKFDTGGNTYKTKENSFAWVVGAGVRFNMNNNWALFTQSDYGTTKLFDRNQNNIRVTAGVIKKFRTTNVRANNPRPGTL